MAYADIDTREVKYLNKGTQCTVMNGMKLKPKEYWKHREIARTDWKSTEDF